MRFDWIPFTETETSYSARITIRQTGQFGFTSGAINRFKIEGFKYGILHYDPVQRAVGIELTNDQKPGAMLIKHGTGNTYLRGKNFCERYEIDYSKMHRYRLREDKESGLLYFLLADEVETDADDDVEVNTAANTETNTGLQAE